MSPDTQKKRSLRKKLIDGMVKDILCALEVSLSLRNFWAQKEALFALIRKNKQLASFQFLLTKSIEQILSKESI